MSSPKSATRRTALFAGSSLLAASLTAVVSAGAALAPTAAFAQTATCVEGAVPLGAGPAVVIPAGTHNPGVTCTYVGDGATVSTDGAITVSSSGGVPADPLVNGVNLRATGTSDIIWSSTAGTVTGSSQTNGPVIEALTAQGDITLNVASVTGSSATVTDGVRAVSSGGGNVAVTVLNPTGTATVSATNSTTGDAAIEAVSTGGNGDVSVTLGNASFFGNAVGRLYGIQARASGAGDLTVNLVRGSISNNATAGVAAVDLTTGTGALTLSAASSSLGSTSNLGHALRLNTGGDANITVAGLNGRGLDNAVLDMTTSSGTLTTVTSTGRIGIGAITSTLDPYQTRAMEGRGGGDIQINTQDLRGVVDFSALTGDVTLAVANAWNVQATSRFGSGDDTVSIGAGGALTLFSNDRTPSPITTIIFGAGVDTFNNAGVIRFDGFGIGEAITLSLEGLETFNNSGLIRLGNASSSSSPAATLATDGDPLSVLMMPGTTFTGSGDSLVLMDVSYSSPNQTACDPALRDADTGEMPAADCIGIQGGATAGETRLLVFDRVPGDRGFNNSIVLVDVAGGTSEAGHFVLDERSDHYSPENGGVIDKNLLTYALVYDADVQQHMLLSTPGANALQFALLPSVAHSLWRTTTGTWFDRQADLRVGELPELGGGVWMRLAGEIADRDAIQTVETASATLEYDGSFEQKSYAVTGGIDLIAGGGASSAYVVGLMAGYANAKFEYTQTANKGSYDGFSGGAYASFLSGGLFVDAAVNANRLVLKEDIPTLNLFPSGTIVDTNLVSVGGQVEAGWRFPIMDGAFVEPLASASYVRIKYDELEIPSDDPARPRIGVDYDDPTSLRAGLGGRIGLEQDYGAVRAQYSILARAWNEFEGENTAALTSVAGDTLMVDDFSGQFNEVAFGASVYSGGGIVSGFLNLGGKFGDDYEAKSASAGVRVHW